MSEADLAPFSTRFSELRQPAGRRGRPASPARAMRRADRIAWRGLSAAVELVVSEIGRGNYQAAIYLINRCLGSPTARLEADITSKSLTITPAELAAELHRLRLEALSVLQAQDTANQLPQPAPPDTATTPE